MLENTRYQVKKEKRLTIGYFGGSITEGAGASDPEKTSWRAKTTAWFRTQFPQAVITPVQAAIGGTGSDLGAYRCDRDLLTAHPDLVFFEFAVNDCAMPYEEVARNTESIVRKIRMQNPCADMIMVYTTTQAIYQAQIRGEEYTSRAAQSAVAHAYGIDAALDVGAALEACILRAGGDWKMYTKDTVHPNDGGYAVYTRVVTEALEAWLVKPEAPVQTVAHPLPKPLFAPLRTNAHMTNAAEALPQPGWKSVAQTLCGRYPNYIETKQSDAPLTFVFEGHEIGLYMMLASDSGYLEFCMDGGDWERRSTWDKYCKSFDRAGPLFLSRGLLEGQHTLMVRAIKECPPESKGNAVRIGAFLVC